MNVEIEGHYVLIREDNGDEVVYWEEQEWLDDPNIVPAICNAIHLAYSSPEELRKILKKIKNGNTTG